MDKFQLSQFLKLFFILAFLVITPLLSSSLRPTYLYLALNFLIIALGAESGLLSFIISNIPHDHNALLATIKQTRNNETETLSDEYQVKKKPELMKKFISTTSLVIAGKEEKEKEVEFVEDGFQENVGEISGEDLYEKAETFIGNFYKQLKMQREESWQNLHGVYQ